MKPKSRYRRTAQLTVCLAVMGILGLFLQLVAKDQAVILAPAFYGLAPLVVVGALATSFALSVRFAPKRRVVILGIALLVGVFVWIRTDYVTSATQTSEGYSLKIVFWNIARPAAEAEAFVPVLKQIEGDIMVLAESGGCGDRREKFWTSHFPDRHVSLLGGGLALLSKYRVTNAVMHKVDYRTRFGVYDLDTPFGPMSVVAADLPSNPFIRRQPLIRRAHDLAMSKSNPVIVLGDFNTPHTSVFFDDFHESFQHAFEKSGNGLITTWPAFLPLLALDHIWLSEHFVPLRTLVQRTWHSDHGLVVADVRLKEQN